jgi:CubicO group peptidase (beta-lactamase class C family)
MKVQTLAVVCVFALSTFIAHSQPTDSATADAQRAKDEAARGEALRVADAWLDSVQGYQHIPSIAAGVVVGDKLVWSKGYGTIDAEHKVPATPDTIYSICSISKLFTSISLMQLYEAGKVNLDAPITTYLPWATIQPAPESGPISLRGLLTHSAGIPRESDSAYWSGPDFPFPTEDEIKAKIASQKALYPAEQYFQYSNLGLTLVGETVEAVSGEKYTEYAQKHLLTPLNLTDTRTYLPVEYLGTRLAVGYGALKRDGTRDVVKPFNTRGITPAAGYTSTVNDLAKFVEWQFKLLRDGGTNVLKASTLREMQRVQFMDPGWQTSYGLGFAVSHLNDHIYVGHGGDCPGYQTAVSMRNDDQTAVIVLDTGAEVAGPFAKSVFAILDKRKGYAFKAPAPAKDVNLEDYAGVYTRQPWGAELVVLPWAGGLTILGFPSADPAEELTFLKPKGGDIFKRVRKDGSEAEEINFVRDASGKVTNFVHFSNPTWMVKPLGQAAH